MTSNNNAARLAALNLDAAIGGESKTPREVFHLWRAAESGAFVASEYEGMSAEAAQGGVDEIITYTYDRWPAASDVALRARLIMGI